MRPQQNRRLSSSFRRGSNNSAAQRHTPNPLTRNFESTGPEVKIRGNAQNIADKYLALARDAQALGDRVLGESYLQHAEHYTRIILSAQAAENNARPVSRPENAKLGGNGEAQPPADLDIMPQPVLDGVPGEVALMPRNSIYKESEADEADAEQARPRRRLPARRSNPNARRPAGRDGGSPHEAGVSRAENAENASAEDMPAWLSRAAVPESRKPAEIETAEEEAPRISRPRKPRAPKPAPAQDGHSDI